MQWKNNLIENLQWSEAISNREGKERVAEDIAAKITEGQVVGVGSGSTVYLALFAIAKRMKQERIRVKVIPGSMEISMTCLQLGIPQTTLWDKRPDWTFDGADEVDAFHNLIKGRGGAMFNEKLLICSSAKVYIIIDETKLVTRLGENFPVPVEVFPKALVYVENRLRELGASQVVLRPAKGKDGPVVTENGNFILDAWFGDIGKTLEKEIKVIPGVIESGLFLGYNPEIIVAGG